MIVQGQASTASTTLVLPAHAVGDLLFMIMRFPNTTPGSPPAPGGTVPTWNILESSGATFLSLVTTWARATAANHTSGVWTGSSQLGCLVLRADAGNIIAPAGISLATHSSATTITYPALTLTTLAGTSWGVRAGTRVGAAATVGNPPTADWTTRIIQPAGASANLSVHTRANLVADPVADLVTIGGAAGAYRAHTVEVTEQWAGQRMATIA